MHGMPSWDPGYISSAGPQCVCTFTLILDLITVVITIMLPSNHQNTFTDQETLYQHYDSDRQMPWDHRGSWEQMKAIIDY